MCMHTCAHIHPFSVYLSSYKYIHTDTYVCIRIYNVLLQTSIWHTVSLSISAYLSLHLYLRVTSQSQHGCIRVPPRFIVFNLRGVQHHIFFPPVGGIFHSLIQITLFCWKGVTCHLTVQQRYLNKDAWFAIGAYTSHTPDTYIIQWRVCTTHMHIQCSLSLIPRPSIQKINPLPNHPSTSQAAVSILHPTATWGSRKGE